MAYATFNKPSLHFNSVLYTGNGGTNAITGVGFQPDFVWIKVRDDTSSHRIFDVVRGVTKRLKPDQNEAEATGATELTTFGADGFTVGSSAAINGNGENHVAWNWKASNSTAANSDGDIASTVSVNTSAGFSVVKWTANGSQTDGVGHGLGVAPKIVLYKEINQAGSWYWLYKYVDGTLDYLTLNTNTAKSDSNLSTYGFTTSTTITNFGFANTRELIAYCFAEKTGYSKLGFYTSNGNADGPFIYTGFKPALVLVKNVSSTAHWMLYDNKRDVDNPNTKALMPNLNNAEDVNAENVDFLSNGFKCRGTGVKLNNSTDKFIYMAFAAEPLVANVGQSIPATAV